MPLTRRRLLIAGGAGAVVAGAGGLGLVVGDVLPGHAALQRLTGACAVDRPVPRVDVGSVQSATLRSRAMQGDVPYALWVPTTRRPAGSRLPVCVVLHGRAVTGRRVFDALGLHHFASAAFAAGAPPFAIVAPDGGDHYYWHRRANGLDPQKMITDELLPALRGQGLDADRLGAYGWSMGGYGALLLAESLGQRVRAVAVSSAAVWTSYADVHRAVPDAFDSQDDWDRHDVIRRIGELGGALRVDCGTADPFHPADRTLVQHASAVLGAARVTARFSAGCHTDGYWRSRAQEQMAFLASALAG